jgi:hypothetical protein
MKLNLLSLFIYYSNLLITSSISINDNNYLILRNYALRITVLKDIKKTKLYIKNIKTATNNLYNKMLTVLYDANYKYYSLSDEERDFLENIISLCY